MWYGVSILVVVVVVTSGEGHKELDDACLCLRKETLIYLYVSGHRYDSMPGAHQQARENTY